ncbi:Phototropic-responsive NPH3 family protein [Rhynchospora pubera]|uniref:Phototropic-responsive NPH3 family protein n=1 Tax=Rhynchospora pubera TaxID=906938 RepID=A0AAV8F1N3_9POAL|nr:Phototropic-responsive NPH3 family protein [Rhynchospora pubera]
MAVSFPSSQISPSMDRTTQWVFSQDLPTDLIVEVGNSCFPLHKLMMVPKSGYIRKKVHQAADPAAIIPIEISDIPGGAEAFDRAARFCYGVNFEITVYNIAALRCAAEYLEMTEEHGEASLASRTVEFLEKAALKTLSGAVSVLRSCEELLPFADKIGLVQRSIDVIGLKACKEATFPTRSPTEWWAAELSSLPPIFFQKVLAAMQARSASPKTLATAISTYTNLTLPNNATLTSHHRTHLESIVSLLPPNDTVALPVSFFCVLLRNAIAVSASPASHENLEKRISSLLDTATLTDLLTITLDPSGERIANLDSVRKVISGFVERETSGSGRSLAGIFYGGGVALCSAPMQKVARMVDAFVAEIATDAEMPISKFVGIAGAIPKSARKFDDDLYRAVDIYLKAHHGLDEIDREKVCSVMDPLKLSYEARLHASQNKRLPLQIVLSALYYDQLKIRSGKGDLNMVTSPHLPTSEVVRKQAKADSSLAQENEALRTELARMKMLVSNFEQSQGSGSSRYAKAVATPSKKPTFFASFSRTFGKLNPFRHGSKDTSNITDDLSVDVAVAKPKKRRSSIS